MKNVIDRGCYFRDLSILIVYCAYNLFKIKINLIIAYSSVKLNVGKLFPRECVCGFRRDGGRRGISALSSPPRRDILRGSSRFLPCKRQLK